MGESSLVTQRSSLVLIVEDDIEVRDLLSVELELEGFAVVTASNGAEAVDVGRRLKPDIILMDILMPVMSGIEATRILKGEEDTTHIPIVMVTVIDEREDIVKGLEAGAIDYITKPFFLPELKARLNAILRYKKLYDDLRTIQLNLSRDSKINNIAALISIVRAKIDSALTIISGKTELIRRSRGKASPDDLEAIENAVNSIKHSVGNLGIFEIFFPEVSHIISRIIGIDLIDEFRM